jgi:hypothetical protein
MAAVIGTQPELAPVASLQELLGPAIIHGLGNTLLPEQLRYAVLPAQAIQHNPELVLDRGMLACSARDVLQNPTVRIFRVRRFATKVRTAADGPGELVMMR